MMPEIIPTAEPFFFPGGPDGCLLVHGFTGTPKEMRWMGEHLAQNGCTVMGVRLAGHATCPEDMPRFRWKDWLASVADGWYMLREKTDRIFVMGLSMGGALSLLFAARYPVAGVVAMSTPYDLPRDPLLQFIQVLKWFVPSVAKGPPDWRDLEAASDHIDYPAYPTRSIVELRDLLAEMRSTLPHITAPVLLMHSKDDTGAPPDNAWAIFNRLTTPDKQLIWVEDSGHVITREPQRMKVFQAACDFVNRVGQRLP